ncbi:MAG: hypothetical protein FWC68_01440 [Oscillospiraceae bacterium]|nr:hypothetical protein [Oscillospiraceae bacterium]
MEGTETIDMLIMLAVFLGFLIVVLFLAYWIIGKMQKRANQSVGAENAGSPTQEGAVALIPKTKGSQYTKLSVFDFMEFDTIEDGMIVQKNGARYLMVIECDGINYDLMSEVEKTSVEHGFIQFLNTLRHPIQLYTQTRTINIGQSIEGYSGKVNEIKYELEVKQTQLNQLVQSRSYSQKQVDELKWEIVRLQNLYEYGADIVSNIEKMSLNKNVLRKHYYIVVPFNSAELSSAELLHEEEKKNMIFSELYTRAQSITRTLYGCSMKCKVMDSEELMELLYVSYNRDEAEIYSVERAMRAGYAELYSTAPDVLDKKMEALNKLIEEKALQLAQDTVEEVKTAKEKAIAKKEQTLDEVMKEIAEEIIRENKKYVGEDVAEDAIKQIKGTGNEVTLTGTEDEKEETPEAV